MVLASHPGLTPRAIDALSLRESIAMLLGARARRLERLELTSAVLDGMAMYNAFGGAEISFGEHYRAFRGLPKASRAGAAAPADDEWEAMRARHPEWGLKPRPMPQA